MLARAVWVVTAILALGALLASIPGYVLLASQGEFAGCVVEAPVGLMRIFDLAGALASFASALVCFALGALLYWRKPRDWMALFVSFSLREPARDAQHQIQPGVAVSPLTALSGAPQEDYL
ncbi:MAG: hypothetical protein ACXWP6_19625 [Ktedonobacterales bacterium]